jgi:hypothetical protein
MNLIFRKAQSFGALLAISFGVLSCVSPPAALERITSDDCLVLIPCTMANKASATIGRTYFLHFSDARRSVKIAKKPLSYIPVRVSEPGLTIQAIKSNIDEGFIGDKSQSDLEIALPYERGKVIVTDYTFDQVITTKDGTTWIHWRFLDTSEDTSARCVSLFMKSTDADSWK